MNLKDHGRFPYSAITCRPDFRWPDGKRLAVYIGLNLEHFSFGEGLGAELAPGGPQPDVLNFAWREYGNRVGAWRLMELFDEFRIPSSVLINASILDHCPALATAFAGRGDEIVGHGRTNSERQSALSESDEKTLIAETTERLAQGTGQRPRGWLGPWISQSRATPDLLKEAGYEYLLDWCHDDQPVWMKTRSGPILSVPYPQELNDIPAIAVRRESASSFADMIVDNTTEMLKQCERQPLVMGIALHGYIIGQPFRLHHLRRALTYLAQNQDKIWFTTSGAIARHYSGLFPAA